MDIDDGNRHLGQELAGEDLHVAGQNDQVHIALEQLELLLLGGRLGVALHRHVEEGYPELSDVVMAVGMVRYHHRYAHLEVTAPLPPEQIEQAVVRSGHEDGHALLQPRLDEPDVESQLDPQPQPHRLPQRVELDGQPRQVEHGALEEPPAGRIARGLVERDDVGSVLTQHGRYARHDPGAVSALHDEAPEVGVVVRPGHARPTASETDDSSVRRQASVPATSLNVKTCRPWMLLLVVVTAVPSRRARRVGS